MLALIFRKNFELIIVVGLSLICMVYIQWKIGAEQVKIFVTPATFMTVGIIDNDDGSATIVEVPSKCVDASLHVIPACEKAAASLPQWWTN